MSDAPPKTAGFELPEAITSKIRDEAEKGARKATEGPIKLALLLAAIALYEATKPKKKRRRR